MATLEAVVSSDWHLNGLAKHFSNHLERQVFELDKAYQYAINNGISHLFVPGDISDTPKMEEEAYMILLEFLKKYDGLVHTYYIPGNHDFSDIRKTSMDLMQLLYMKDFFKTFHLFLKPAERVIEGVPINFLPYPCREAPKSKIPHLNFSHIVYNGAIGDNGRPLRGSTHEFTQNEGDFNVSGHIHTYQYLKSKRAIFCGNPYQKNFGEALPKGLVHLKARFKNNVLDVRHKFVDTKPDFQFINLTIESRRDFAKLSNSDAFRYKLWIAPGVEVPKNLKSMYPNITGGIFDITSKRKTDDAPTIVTESVITAFNVKKQLASHLKAAGYDKSFIRMAYEETLKASNELGVSFSQ